MNIAEQVTQLKKDFDEVYEAGRAAGGDTDAAYQQGIADGKQAEHDAFWDAYQNNGNRVNYQNAFWGEGWNDTTFKPKHEIKPTSLYNTFQTSNITDLKGILDRCGVKWDTSQSTSMSNCFSASKVTHLPTIDLSSAIGTSMIFDNAKQLITIDKIVVAESTLINGWFSGCSALQAVTFEGTIGQNGLSLGWSTKLSKSSITSIINALSTTTSGLSVTFSKTAVENAFGSTTADEWTALIATKPNWTITLA